MRSAPTPIPSELQPALRTVLQDELDRIQLESARYRATLELLEREGRYVPADDDGFVEDVLSDDLANVDLLAILEGRSPDEVRAYVMRRIDIERQMAERRAARSSA